MWAQHPHFEPALNPATAGEGMEPIAFVALAARHGYRWVEFDSRQARDLARRGEKDLALACRSAGVSVASFFLPVDWRGENDGFRADLAALPPILERLSEAGARRSCTFLFPNASREPTRHKALLSERFGLIADRLAEHGMRFGLEFLGPEHFRCEPGHTVLYRLEDMLAFAIEIGPRVGILVDSLHWHCLGADADLLAAVPTDRLVYAHINDAPPVPLSDQRDDDRLLPGEGHIDLGGFLAALARCGYAGPIGIEVDGPRLRGKPADEAAYLAMAAWVSTLSRHGFMPGTDSTIAGGTSDVR